MNEEHTDLGLDQAEVDAYRTVAEGGAVTDQAAVDRLVRLGLVDQAGDRRVALDPRVAMQQLMAVQRNKLLGAIAAMEQIPAALEALAEHYDPSRMYGGPGSEFLATKSLMNRRIGEVLERAAGDLLTVQPGEPEERDPVVVQQAMERSTSILARGVRCRFLYSAAALDHAPTRAYVEAILNAGGEVRVGRDLPPRMIISDRSLFVENHVVPGEEDSGWHVTDVPSIASHRAIFDSYWERATPWQEARRALAETVTSARQRTILRAMETADSQAKVAARVGVSEREVSRQLSLLRDGLGLNTNYQLVIWWARSPERDLP
ncbi:regulatory protein [Streptomyces laurentii]|uniref:Regulatory protein n=1 Tax=Streptomyces laurentii TaxID=39478 RepID=A0A161JHD1_STRLU|nr:regulatory protein [Streptomyces laurentii]